MDFGYSRQIEYMVGLTLSTALITHSIVEEFEEYIVMTNFMHAVIAIFPLKQSDSSIHFICIVNTCNIKAENLVPFLPWAT